MEITECHDKDHCALMAPKPCGVCGVEVVLSLSHLVASDSSEVNRVICKGCVTVAALAESWEAFNGKGA